MDLSYPFITPIFKHLSQNMRTRYLNKRNNNDEQIGGQSDPVHSASQAVAIQNKFVLDANPAPPNIPRDADSNPGQPQ